MSSRMTREDLLRRGAVGVGALSVPGLLAACVPGPDGMPASENALRKLAWLPGTPLIFATPA